MSGLAGALSERVTVLESAGRDALGGEAGWSDGAVLWAKVAPDGAGPGDDAGAAARFAVTLRVSPAAAMAERLRWRGLVLRVRRIESDPAEPDRILLRTEVVR